MNIDLEAKSPEFGDMKELYAMWIKQGYLDKFKNDVSRLFPLLISLE